MNDYNNLIERSYLINNTGKYCLLSISVAYIICAVIQWRVEGLLPAWLYFLIAGTSLSIALFEIIKALIDGVIWFSNSYINLRKQYDSLGQRHIKLFSQTDSLEQEVEKYKRLLIDEEGSRSIEKNIKRFRFANKLQSVITCIEIMFVTVMIITTPLKAIPYDEKTMKLINVSTIITFGLLFFSLFIKNWIEEDKIQTQVWLSIEQNNMMYYLDVLEKAIGKKEEECS